MDAIHGYYFVNFDIEGNIENSILYKTLCWVRFPSLGIVYYDESVLLSIASAIGTPIKVDTNTRNMTQGHFARVCVRIDLNVLVVEKFNLNANWYNVEYHYKKTLRNIIYGNFSVDNV
uniref:Uncharacterized protein n=1 Tax=Cajanus cajan TaxID=3821 RepID=A0A151SYX7_CAJCA|nr:hypothetical protein KK1_015456 [Cajanus cajan]